MSLDNPNTRVAVVTGASAGVGRSTAAELARRGWDVALLARGSAGLAAAAAEVEAHGRRALVVPTDVADHDQVATAAERVENELGPIDCWVNNAMTTTFARIRDLEPHEIERTTAVTYLGQANGALVALERMRPRDRGTIVFVGSALAYRGIPLQAPYCAAKFAVRGFHDALRCELLDEGSNIRTTIVHLPAVNTPQFNWCRAKVGKHPQPVAPIYQPEAAATAIVNAAESTPRQKIFGVWNWLLVGLSNLMPGIGDHYMARSAVGGQLTETAIDEDRPDNLYTPVDQDVDHGAHGIFDERAHGARTRSFLAGLPAQARTFAAAARARAREIRDKRAG